MARSVLLQLVRDSIEEVLEAQRTIDKQALLKEHPLLNEKITTTVNIYIGERLRGTFSSLNPDKTLLEDIIYNAKKSAFEDENSTPLSTSEYISCEIELLLNSPDGPMSQRDPAIFKN